MKLFRDEDGAQHAFFRYRNDGVTPEAYCNARGTPVGEIGEGDAPTCVCCRQILNPTAEGYHTAIEVKQKAREEFMVAVAKADPEVKPAVAPDMVNHPPHYQLGGIEVADAIEAWNLDWHRGNTVKYIARAGRKTGSDELEDLKKARWYLDRAIVKLEKKKP